MKTQTPGVELLPNGRYRARYYHDGKQNNIGYFDSYDEAVSARKLAELRADKLLKGGARQPTPGLDSTEEVLRIHGPMHALEIRALTGQSLSRTHTKLKALHAAKRIHIMDWTRFAPSGPWTAVWAAGFGNGEEAAKPEALSRAKRSANSRAKAKRERVIAAGSPLSLALANLL